ncbi:putative malate dehydrogenase 1B [Lineus longissimus]|uniref:putative malate dehydrogenase 1B n=1 Tax=Lineus longissimus TaxID=88925 RepID=UPI002B4F16BA
MAKIVIAGRANCPYFAKSELLADNLAKNLDDFKLHKIVIQPSEWEEWLSKTCSERKWLHTKSPMVWRELIDRGGKGVLIGGANDFQEYARGYYSVVSNFISDDMLKIAEENLKTKDELDEEERSLKALSKPVNICITNASSPVSYGLIPEIAKGVTFGDQTEVTLHLLDSEENIEGVGGVEFEAVDLACPLLRGVKTTSDPKAAFKDCSVIILLDEIKKGEEEENSDWLKRNFEFFTNYANIIGAVAKKDVKILIGGAGPVNFITDMMIRNAPEIPRQNFVAFSRLLENQVKAVIGHLLKVNSAYIVDALVWGNPAGERFVDIAHCRVHNFDGAIWGPPFYSRPVKELIYDKKWLEKEFQEMVNSRQQNLVTTMNHRNSVSHAAAIATLLQHWVQGSPEGQIFSLGVYSEGDYGIPEGLVCSVPVRFHSAGYWELVKDIEMAEEENEKIKLCVEDLTKEYEVIFPPPFIPPPTPPAEQEAEGGKVFGTEESQQTDDAKKEEDGNSSATMTGTTSESEGDTDKLAKIVEEKGEEEKAEQPGDGQKTDESEDQTEEADE